MKRLLALLLLAGGTTALAQDDVTVESGVITISQAGGRDLPIAVPKPKGSTDGVDEIWEVVRADLDRSEAAARPQRCRADTGACCASRTPRNPLRGRCQSGSTRSS